MPSCNTYHLTWVSLTLDEGYLLTAAPPDLEPGVAPLGPPVPVQPPLLGHGVAPHVNYVRCDNNITITYKTEMSSQVHTEEFYNLVKNRRRNR